MLQRIKLDPQVCGGRPTIRGLRFTVDCVLKLIGDAYYAEHKARQYPELEKRGRLRGSQVRRLVGERAHFCVNVRPLAVVWREGPPYIFLLAQRHEPYLACILVGNNLTGRPIARAAWILALGPSPVRL